MFANIDELIEYYISNFDISQLKSYLKQLYGTFIIELVIEEHNNITLINLSKLRNLIEINSPDYKFIQLSPNYIIKNSKIITKFLSYNEKSMTANNSFVTNKLTGQQIIDIIIMPRGDYYVVFYNEDDSKWYACSHIIEYLNETTFGTKMDLNKLNTDYCYHVAKTDSDIVTLLITKKYTNIITESNLFKTGKFDDLQNDLTDLGRINKENKKIINTGFIIIHNQDDIYKIYEDTYCFIKDRSNLTNIHELMLDLYKKDKLTQIAPLITKYVNDNINRINIFMKTLSKEILNIYHITRQKNSIYNDLPLIYKKILSDIHNIYITEKTNTSNKNEYELIDSKSITIHDIYYYLKDTSTDILVDIGKQRLLLIENNNLIIIPYHNSTCIYTVTETKLLMTPTKPTI